MTGPAKVHPLQGNQMRAVAPDETVWLSASAGTGKTQVLSSRVLRLLLQEDVEPSQILCLTFTKAGATEMAARINGTLAEWVRLPAGELSTASKRSARPLGPRRRPARARCSPRCSIARAAGSGSTRSTPSPSGCSAPSRTRRS
jgi:ATP-dependent helicase/nuclease subunit A